MVLLLLLFLGSAYAATECPNFVVSNEWGDGFDGILNVKLDHETHGWKATLDFDKAFTEIDCFVGTASTNDNKHVEIVNLEWDGDLHDGDIFEFHFVLRYAAGDRPRLVGATFDGSNACGDGPATTSGPATTAGTTTKGPTRPPGPGKYDYYEVIEKSMLFYEANRVGALPIDNRIPWRKDAATSDKIPGGYFDAGDHVKFGFPMAAMTTILAWGAVSFPQGYENAGQTDWMVDTLKWSTDYFIAAHTADNELYGQVGDGNADHAWWGRPEEMPMERPAYKIDASHPGSDLAGETSAALAASSMYFRANSVHLPPGYADICLQHARQLFEFADNYRGVYTDAIPAADFYQSWSGFHDELFWSAAWLYKATGEQIYLDKAESFYDEFGLDGTPAEFAWDDKTAGAQLLMLELTGSDKYAIAVNNFVDYILSASTTLKGLVWIASSEWGSLRHAGNLAHYAFQAARLGVDRSDECWKFGETQINYILGDGGRSYVVGWGDNPPQRPHHRGSSCPDRPQVCDWEAFNNPGPNGQVLVGALVGGPDGSDNFVDDRENFKSNEVATDYNAGFQSSLAALSVGSLPTTPPLQPTTTPSGACPGGSLANCVAACPSTPSSVWEECVQGCMQNCDGLNFLL